MKFIFTLLLAVTFLSASAQEIKNAEWQKDRKLYVLTEKEQSYPEYILLLQKQFDYEWEKDALMMFQTEHRITRVTNSEAIQRQNRIYISLKGVVDIVDLKARTINKDGKVVNFDRNNLKEIKDEETNTAFKIFAMEGVEGDSELEFFYTLKMKSRLFDTEYLQFETPIKQISLKISSPKKLIFDCRLYNTSSNILKDTVAGKNILSVTLNDVEGLPHEKFSYYNTNRKRAETKLAFNVGGSNARLNTWADAAKSNYALLTHVDKDNEKLAEKFIKTLGDDKTWPPVKRIKNIEDKIKNSIRIVEPSSEAAYQSISDILKYKQAGGQGITSLMAICFEKVGVPYNIVITCDRENSKFDPSFDTWNFLDEYLFYFPDTKGFLTPSDNQLRYPLVPPQFTATKGLFIEPIVVGSIHSAIGSVHDIPALPCTSDRDDHVINVTFNNDMESNLIDYKQTFIGFQAAYFIAYYSQMTQEQKDKLILELLKRTVPDVKIIKWSVDISEIDLLPSFEIKASFTSNQLLENAGNKILFKIGEIIGPQTELYRDDSRVTDVENSNNRSYDRIITMTIPKGYKIGNADALKMNVAYKDNNATPFLFLSDYTIDKSVVTIKITEYYKEIYTPVKRYEDFRKVVNASADFNKITLVLEKE